MDRPGELNSGMQQLKRATRDFQLAWSELQKQWDDATAGEFQHRHLDPLLPTLRLVLAASTEVEELFRRVVRECRDPGNEDAGQL